MGHLFRVVVREETERRERVELLTHAVREEDVLDADIPASVN